MRHPNAFQSVLTLAVLALAAGHLCAAPDLQIRPPVMDGEGRFWVYRNGPTQPRMPFLPYGWMSDTTNLTQLGQIDLESNDHPNTAIKTAGISEKEHCMRVKLVWGDATWASIAYISGPDKPAWWGETNRGRYYNLSVLPKKKLVFHLRGDHGGEIIKVQMGVLGDKPFGDSLTKPIVSAEIKLTQAWVRYEIDLKDVPNAELANICNGFGVNVEHDSQPGNPTETQFFIDDVYFE